MGSFQKKSSRYLLFVLVIYAVLVAPHEGEFWPFSIYPMFSKAGQPWTRAIARDMTSTPEQQRWETTDLQGLHGSPVSLQDFGVDQIDYANFVSKTDHWDHKRQTALQQMFGSQNLADKKVMVMKVSGLFNNQDSIVVQAVPLFLVSGDTVRSNPTLSLTDTRDHD